jgi:DNA-binding MarR family transcriptional regulator
MTNLPFGFEKPQDSPGFLLWQATTLWQRQIKKALDPYDLSQAQFVIMAILMWSQAQQHDTTQVLIVNWTKLDKMTVSTSLKKLVTLGFVKRIEHHTDTRAKQVTLTKKGSDMVRKLVPIVESIDEAFFSKTSMKNQKNLIDTLGTLVTA